MVRWCVALGIGLTLATVGRAQEEESDWNWSWQPAILQLLRGDLSWKAGDVLIRPPDRPDDPCQSIRDPSVVQYNQRWHLFCTTRGEKYGHRIEYASFGDWPDAGDAQWHVLNLGEGDFASPQVFYFEPQKKWYLIYQIRAPGEKAEIRPVYSTNTDVARPEDWSKPMPLLAQRPSHVRLWTDFRVVCDEATAFLFFTSPDGRLWRSETTLENFPTGWKQPVQALQGDFVRGLRVYQLKRLHRYLALVEATERGRRYCKAYTASWPDGRWSALADTSNKPFAAGANVRFAGTHWAESIGIGEILREGHDQKMTVHPLRLRFLVPGVGEDEIKGKAYGQVPWRLGMLEAGWGERE